jgi:ribosomal protein S18 acetylase RimI-like enzyme
MIRPVRTSELAALADVAARSYAKAFGDSYTPHELAEELKQNRSEQFFRTALKHGDDILVDVEDGKVRGYVLLTKVNFPELTPQPGDELLDRLYVDPNIQGQGIGRRLLEAALLHPRLARARRIFIQVWSENTRALKLYQSAGFDIFGTTRLGVGDLQDSPEYIMMRPAKVPASR